MIAGDGLLGFSRKRILVGLAVVSSMRYGNNIRQRPVHKLDLPKHDHVTMFIDLKAGSKPTIASMSAGGVSNKELARLDLSHLGTIPRFFRSLSTITNSRGVPEREDRKDCSAIWRNEQGEITHIEIARNRPFEGQEVTANNFVCDEISLGER